MSNYKEAKLKIKNVNRESAMRALQRIRNEIGQGTINENTTDQTITLYVSKYAYYIIGKDGTVGYDDYSMSTLRAEEFKKRFSDLYSQELLAQGMKAIGLAVTQKETQEQLLVVGAGSSGGSGGRWV